MEANLQCPLDPFVMGQLENKMNFARVLEIENHVLSGTCIHPPLKDLILHGDLDGSTPLLLACEEGHLNSVRHIVEDWGADPRAAANFYYSEEEIEGATPIFVAALKRHDDIVQYLIGKNVDVNAITSTEAIIFTEGYSRYVPSYRSRYEGASPLEVALEQSYEQSSDDYMVEKNVTFRLLLEAGANPSILNSDGNPLWFGFGCGVYSVIELIKHDINLDLRSTTGDTILHDWITFASLNLDIIDKEKFFVDGVDLLLVRGIDLTARNKKGLTPILAAADQLKGPSGTLLCILDLLLKKDEIDATEKIDAMELAGARLLLASEPEKASHYWKKALDLRRKEGRKKIPLQTSGQALEWETQEQLEGVIQDKSAWWIQAMLAGLRINASKGLEAVVAFMDDLPFMLGDHYITRVDFREVEKVATVTQISDFCLEILGVFLRFGPYKHPLCEYKEKITQELTYNLLVPYFSTLGKDKPLLHVECQKIISYLLLICAGDPKGFLEPLEYEYGFYEVLACVPDLLLHKDIKYHLIASVRQDDTLLYQAYRHENWKTFRFLIHLQADPNVIRWSGNTVFHLAAERREHPSEFSPAHLLFDYGADPYRKNNQGETPVDLWVFQNCGREGIQSPKWKNRPYWCRNTVPKLSCLVAKTIHTEGIPYSRRPGDLPVELLTFLENH